MPLIEVKMAADESEGTEAAVGRWLKQVGEHVSAAEPLVEISTDKVTLEIASPSAGVLHSIAKAAGEAVNPGDLLGVIDDGHGGNLAGGCGEVPEEQQRGGLPGSGGAGGPTALAGEPVVVRSGGEDFSPVVRRLLLELGLDPANVPKVSRGGRLTPDDIRQHLSGSRESVASRVSARKESSAPTLPGGRLVRHSSMRRSIARHMAESVKAAPHVTSVFEADLFEVLRDRERRRASGDGPVPSVTVYLIEAALRAMTEVPEVNSKWHEDSLEIFDDVNFGVGTALESGGLVVPVIRDAHAMSLQSLSSSLRAMTEKARAGKLTAIDLEGGTFTLSNHGVSGSLLAAPIILPHGQAAILGAGKLQKRVIVCENGGRDLFRVRPMMYVTLTVDHRALDGQQTNRFLTAFVSALERERSP